MASSSNAPFAAGVNVAPGDILAGKYQVERVLGSGGMGAIVAARHLHLDEKVAIKVLLEHALKSPEAVARFEQEARAAVRIKSQHVARIIDVGHLDGGAPYIVMEYLEGGDLSAWLDQRGAMSVEQAAEFVIQACDALAEAHSLGIVHRDLKPPNLFCVRGADNLFSIKVLDFGISKILWNSGGARRDQALTRTQTLIGTPLYMSPEQMQSSKDVDARTDIWSLGVILFELLAGRPPFEGDELPSLVLKIATTSAPSLRALRPDVPPALESAVLRCLEKDPARRYANVGELAAALGPFAPLRTRAVVDRILRIVEATGLASTAFAQLHDLPRTSPVPSTPLPPPPPDARPPSLPPSTPMPVPSIAPWGDGTISGQSAPSSRPVAVLFGAACLFTILAIGVLVAWLGSSRPSLTSAATPPAATAAFVAASALMVAEPVMSAEPVTSAVASVPTIAASSLPVVKAAPPMMKAIRSPAPHASAPVVSAPPKVPSYDHM